MVVQGVDKASLLTETLLHRPQRQVNLTDLEPHQEPAEWVAITEAEIAAVLHHMGKEKAPGPSLIDARTLQIGWPLLKSYITQLFNVVMDTGYHPQHWRQSITAILKKPHKPDYSSPQAYRPIALLDVIGKVLEGVISCRLAYWICPTGWMSDLQFGRVPGRSCTDAGLWFTHKIREVQKAG
jgi:hypothetical protein